MFEIIAIFQAKAEHPVKRRMRKQIVPVNINKSLPAAIAMAIVSQKVYKE